MQSALSSINNRYQLLHQLGEGAMGSVYRSYDRLNKHEVALKKVAGRAVSSNNTGETSSVRLTIAHEFQTLASLHHPNIIDVLDYGFDENAQPYFTMLLLEGAQPLTRYAQGKSQETKVNLLIQTLQALIYLHRRRIFHRDLKPDNALVTADGLVKVLDFGLAVPQEDSSDMSDVAGTIAYIAPEVLQSQSPTAAADLYAVGVMAYEMFAGRHPFNVGNIALLIPEILNKRADIAALDVEEELGNVIERLLEKDPTDRYEDARKVLEDLCKATAQTIPVETVAIRESFLQAAQFIGREKESKKLLDALNQTLEGQGDFWLIGGESGVGKTRLVDEIRIQATVKGALVLHGQGIAEGGVSYQMWRYPLRRALLAADVSDVDAAILQSLIPDISDLLEREIPPAPDLEGQAGRKRLFETIASVFRQQKQPILLLLEDLQWAVESLDVLKFIAPLCYELPLMIVGNYRDDEAPNLPKEFTLVETIKLERLNDEGIRKLSMSMLGDSGQSPDLVDFLKRETEGNVFFLVEVVRALAEDAGRLSEIGTRTLPAQVFAGGVRQVVQRRLSQVSIEVREVLELAAVAGRYIDFQLLKALSPNTDMDAWLLTVSGLAILEPVEEIWRFSHDKLREGLLQSLSNERLETIHAQIAEALQTVYAYSLEEYASQIAEHYERANIYGKAANWHARAGRHAQLDYVPAGAINHYERALRLLDRWGLQLEESSRLNHEMLLHGYSKMLIWQGRFEDANKRLEQLREISREKGNREMLGKAWHGVATLRITQGDVAGAVEAVSEAEKIARENKLTDELVAALWLKGWAVLRTGKIEEARALGEELHQIANDSKHQDALDQGHNLLGAVYYSLGDYEKAINSFRRAYEIQVSMGKRSEPMATINNVGFLMAAQGDYHGAVVQYQQAIRIAQDTGQRAAELIYRGNRAGAWLGSEKFKEAEAELIELIPQAEAFGMGELAEMRRYLAEVYLGQGYDEDATDEALRCLKLSYELNAGEYLAAAWRVLGQAIAKQQKTLEVELGEEKLSVDAPACFEKSIAIAEESGALGEKAHTLKAWALYENGQGAVDSAQERWTQARDLFKQVGASFLVDKMPEEI